MRSSTNNITVADSCRPNQQSTYSFPRGKQQQCKIIGSKKITEISMHQKLQNSIHIRKPLQILNANTHVAGNVNLQLVHPSIKTSKSMAKSQQQIPSNNIMMPRKTYSDEETSTISANENNEVKCQDVDVSEIFRRRMDAADEKMEDYWVLQPANPIMDSDEEDDEADEQLECV